MIVNVVGQINMHGIDLNVYQFPNTSLMSDNAYFGHLEVLHLLLGRGLVNIRNIDEVFNHISADDIIDFKSTKDENVRHIFIKVECFDKLANTTLFSRTSWKDLIHPVRMEL